MVLSFNTVGYLVYDRKFGSVYDRNAVNDRFFSPVNDHNVGTLLYYIPY